jgi:hypothetical protein
MTPPLGGSAVLASGPCLPRKALSGTTMRNPVAENLPPMAARVDVCSLSDVFTARQKGRDLARVLGFSATDQAMIVTAISELARYIVRYAGYGASQLRVQRSQIAFGPRGGPPRTTGRASRTSARRCRTAPRPRAATASAFPA